MMSDGIRRKNQRHPDPIPAHYDCAGPQSSFHEMRPDHLQALRARRHATISSAAEGLLYAASRSAVQFLLDGFLAKTSRSCLLPTSLIAGSARPAAFRHVAVETAKHSNLRAIAI